MIGVESVERSRSTNATKNRIDSGVAGRNMMAKNAVSRYRRAGLPKTGLHDSIVVLRLKMIAQQSGTEVEGCNSETSRRRAFICDQRIPGKRATN